MKPSVIIKRTVDAAMYVLLLLLMGQCVLGGAPHEWMGISVGILFFIHNGLNIRWYQSLFKGKYTALRRVQTAVNLLLILAVLVCMVSGILISQHLFAVQRGEIIEVGRHVHLVATAWAFVLMTVHLGLHWSVFSALWKKLPASGPATKWISVGGGILGAALCAYGLYQLMDRRFWEELLHLIDYQKEYDYSQSLGAYFAGTASLSALFIALGHYGKKFLLKRRKTD